MEGPENPGRRNFLKLGAAALVSAATGSAVKEAVGFFEKTPTTADRVQEWVRALHDPSSPIARILMDPHRKATPMEVAEVLRAMQKTALTVDESIPPPHHGVMLQKEFLIPFRNGNRFEGNGCRLLVRDPHGVLRSVEVTARHVIECLPVSERAGWIFAPHDIDVAVRCVDDPASRKGIHFNPNHTTSESLDGQFGVVIGNDNKDENCINTSFKRYQTLSVTVTPLLVQKVFPESARNVLGNPTTPAQRMNASTLYSGARLVTLPPGEATEEIIYPKPSDGITKPIIIANASGMSGSPYLVYDPNERIYRFAGIFFLVRKTHKGTPPEFDVPVGFVCGPEQVRDAINHAFAQNTHVASAKSLHPKRQ